MKKLKLAIFAVQAKSDVFFPLPKKQTWGVLAALLQPFIQSCRQTASREALAAIDSIMVSKSRWGPLVAAGGAHYFSKGKTST